MLEISKQNKIKRFVYATSSSAYGDSKNLPKVENEIGKPLSLYAITKYVNELDADIYETAYGLETIGLCYFNVFGKRQDTNGVYAAVIPKFIAQFLKGDSPVINGDSSYSKYFTYLNNVVRMNYLAMTTKNSDALNQGYNTFYLDNINKIFHAREHEFRKSLILLKSNFHWKNLKKKEIFLSSLPESLKKNIRFCIDHPVPSSSLNEFKGAIKVLQKRKCFTKQKNVWVPHLRASIGLTTVLCIQNNVRNLYFGGVDLLNKTTFYDENKLNNDYSLNFIKKNREEKHGTDDTNISKITISEVLKMINEDPYFSIKLHTVSEVSRLRDYLNYININ